LIVEVRMIFLLLALRTKNENVHLNDKELLEFLKQFLNTKMTHENILKCLECSNGNIELNKFKVFKPEPQTISEMTEIDSLKASIKSIENKII
jgi:hypothetical protein